MYDVNHIWYIHHPLSWYNSLYIVSPNGSGIKGENAVSMAIGVIVGVTFIKPYHVNPAVDRVRFKSERSRPSEVLTELMLLHLQNRIHMTRLAA